jgi:hypothetical protein
MTLPLLIFGNRQDKEGFLYYAKDPDCLHAKNFQFFSDGTALHLRTYDLSDHEVEPFGMGGKSDAGNQQITTSSETTTPITESFNYGNIVNTIGWSIRIRPFTSPTIWTDWYGTKLYKNEVVPELEALGAIKTSFYNRYLSGKLELSDTEVPISNVIFGHTSGDISDAFSGSLYLQNLYKTSTSPQSQPKLLNHLQPLTLNAGAIPDSRTGILSNYLGWEPWAMRAIGVATGHGPFASPDFTGVNSSYSGVLPRMLASGQITNLYLIDSFVISSGSVWTKLYSGIGLASKSIYESSRTFTNSDYGTFASEHGMDGSITGSMFNICYSSQEGFLKNNDIATKLASAGASVYHDTAGMWGKGCHASNHIYFDPNTSATIAYSHPGSSFSHYFNKLQSDWQIGFETGSIAGANSNYTGLYQSGFGAYISSEYPCDANLKFAGSSLLYPASSAISQLYFSPLSLSNPLYTGYPRTDALFGALYSFLWNSVSMEAKSWNKLHPMFSIVYGDRCILTDWTSSWINNYLNVSGYFGNVPSGINSLGYPNSVLDTHDHRTTQIKNWMVGHLNHYSRITSSFASPQYSGVNTGWLDNISTTISGVLDSSPWTGIRDYTKKICRLLSYAPDYMYHGTIEHPLESWTGTNNTTAFIPKALRVSKLHNAGDGISGDDTVIHGVRRHRNSESILIWFANWFSGTQTFSGTFDPEIYEFSQGYNTYDLDLNSNSHGTLTNLGLYSKNNPYQISLTIPENNISALIFDVIDNSSSGLNTQQFVNLTTDFSYVRYAYGQKELSTAQLPIVYDYGSQHIESYNPPIEGYHAPATQAILNNLPQWMKMRQDVTSTGWQLVNSWGQNLEDVLSSVNDALPDKFLSSADIKVRSLLRYTDITDPELLNNRQFDNLLFNSSFSLRGLARHKMPAGWVDYDSDSSDVSTNNYKSFICPKTISIGNVGKFGQTVYLDNLSIENLTSSIYILADTHNIDITLITSIEKIDGTSVMKQSKLTSRSREWRRLVHTLDINEQVYRVQFIVISNCSAKVYFNAPKLEISSEATTWTRSPQDTLSYVDGAAPFSLISAIGNFGTNTEKTNIFTVATEEDFLSISIPTRIESEIINSYEDLEPFQNNIFGRKVSFLNEVFDTQWGILDNKIVLRSFSNTEFDVFKEYSLKDLSLNEELTYGVFSETDLSITPLILCVKDHNLFILCKEEYYGESLYTIKIVRAREPSGNLGYLESIVDFEIQIPININQFFNEVEEQPTTLAFSEIDPSVMVITTNLSRQFYCRLYYDYAYYLPESQRLYIIEEYPGSKIQVL